MENTGIVGPYKISKRGGSLQITLPPQISDFLGVKMGDKVGYVVDRKEGRILLMKADKILLLAAGLDSPATLEFSLSSAPKTSKKKN